MYLSYESCLFMAFMYMELISPLYMTSEPCFQSPFNLANLSLSLYPISRTGYGRQKHRRQFPSRSQVRNDNEDIRQSQNIYHFQNCGTVCMSVDSFNAHGVRMENCGNYIPQVTCPYSYLYFFLFHLNWPYHII